MKRRALFVGVDKYTDTQIRNLRCSIRDAHSMNDLFEEIGYEARCLENPGKSVVYEAVQGMTSDLGAGDQFVFYFAGHGFTDSGQHLLFCADDYEELLRFHRAGIPFDFLELKTRAGGYDRSFLLDACRSDFLTGARGADETTRDLLAIGDMVPKDGDATGSFYVLRSCSKYEHALEIESRNHGLFTLAMMDVLRQSRRSGTELLFSDSLREMVRERMSAIARTAGITVPQTPESSGRGDLQVLVSGIRGPAVPAVSTDVVCPVCGRHNQITDTFKCRICQKDYICLRHFNDAENCCVGCAEVRIRVREKKRRCEEEKRSQVIRLLSLLRLHQQRKQEDERMQAEEERKRRKEAERARQEEERKKTEAAPFFTLVLSGVPLKMIKVKTGRFQMGRPVNEWSLANDEKQHRVTLTKDFWLGETPVTQGQWKAVMGNNPSAYQKGDDYPVEHVSWNDAMEFCEKLTQKYNGNLPTGFKFSLPTEAQWEYACRAGTTTSLNSGKYLTSRKINCIRSLWDRILNREQYLTIDNLDEVGWYDKNSGGSTHPVAQKRSNAWGFYDMHGNVYEWCSDWYDKNYGCNNGDAMDPQGPRSGSCRVQRGGSWFNFASCCCSASRFNSSPSLRCNFLGFRLALVPV